MTYKTEKQILKLKQRHYISKENLTVLTIPEIGEEIYHHDSEGYYSATVTGFKIVQEKLFVHYDDLYKAVEGFSSKAFKIKYFNQHIKSNDLQFYPEGYFEKKYMTARLISDLNLNRFERDFTKDELIQEIVNLRLERNHIEQKYKNLVKTI